MQQDSIQGKPFKPYELLDQMTRETIYSVAPLVQENSAEEEKLNLDLTTTHITTMYYAALANLYMQPTLPKTIEEVDAENPRLKIAFNRSYADFMSARKWLDSNGAEFIVASVARPYYDEVMGMEENSIVDTDSFYSQQAE